MINTTIHYWVAELDNNNHPTGRYCGLETFPDGNGGFIGFVNTNMVMYEIVLGMSVIGSFRLDRNGVAHITYFGA